MEKECKTCGTVYDLSKGDKKSQLMLCIQGLCESKQ